MRYRVGLAAGGLLVLLWVFVTAACDALGGMEPSPGFATASVGPYAVTTTCGSVVVKNDSQVTYTAPSTTGTCTLTAARSGYTSGTATYTITSASLVLKGVPYGPFAFWTSATTIACCGGLFTGSIGQNDPASLATQIATARQLKMHLVLCLAGCAHDPVTTSGKFDVVKWRALITKYNTATIRTAIADAVKDGTVVGNSLLDEPHHVSWGGVVTKPMLDDMANYARQYFPALPMGVNFGQGAIYTWRTGETMHAVDYVLNQYDWATNKGDVATYLSKVLARGQLEGWSPAFSLNVLNGGVLDTDGTWDCTGAGQAGTGTVAGKCRMTAAQLKMWGLTLMPRGCVMTMWKYEQAYMSRTDNRASFTAIADSAQRVRWPTCRRAI